MSDNTPAEVFPPGEYIRDELEARGWTQADLAYILGRPLASLNKIMNGQKAITPQTARGLAAAFGTSAELWMNLETAYRLRVASEGTAEAEADIADVARRAKLLSLGPVKEMAKRGWIKNIDSTAELEGELLRFFDIPKLEDHPSLQFAARYSSGLTAWTAAHEAWLCRAKHLARAVKAARFSKSALEQGLTELRQLAGSEHDARRIPRLLADIGIRLLVVEHLPRTRIDGAALWLDDKSPVVPVSLRFDRIDYLWFTLSHEIRHIVHGDGALDGVLDEILVGDDALPTSEKNECEQRADREGADFLVPDAEMEDFISRTRPLYSKKRIIQFANRIRIHPGIVVGQLHRRGEIAYGNFRDLLVKVRDVLTEATLTDGWGHAPPL